MNGFRKFCAAVFFVAAIVSLGALSAFYFGVEPLASFVQGFRGQVWFDYTISILLIIVVVGVVIMFISTLAKRKQGSFQRTDNELGSISVSRATIERVAQEAVELHPEVRFQKSTAHIVNGSNAHIDVTARVIPRGLIQLSEVAPALQADIKDRIEIMTGIAVNKVVIDVRENPDSRDVVTEEELAGPSALALEAADGQYAVDDAVAVEPEISAEPDALEAAGEVETAADLDAALEDAADPVEDLEQASADVAVNTACDVPAGASDEADGAQSEQEGR